MRNDLLALTEDDLATLTNRGTVKRALKELASGELKCEFDESQPGTLSVVWNDGTRCEFPAGGTLEDAICSSGATGISRHVVRSVLAYHRWISGTARGAAETAVAADQHPAASKVQKAGGAEQSTNGGEATTNEGTLQPAKTDSTDDPVAERDQERGEPVPNAHLPTSATPWDPGRISDETLIELFGKAFVSRARKRFEQGVLVELVRGVKPIARFLDEPCTLRFLVPGDVRYVTADCTDNQRKLFTALAVWAFRELPADRNAGLISLQLADLPTPTSLLDDLEKSLEELADLGMSNLSSSWRDRIRRLEDRFRKEQLVWPAELLEDLRQAQDQYEGHDARFDTDELLLNVGELLLRADAIRNNTGAVPQLLVRGTQADRAATLGASRLCGLGCEIVPHQHAATLNIYLQDLNTGSLVVVDRHFSDPPESSGDEPRAFHQLGAHTLTRGVTLRTLAAGQLLLKGAKRTASHRLVLPRTGLTSNPQEFRWEALRPPALVDTFAEVKALQSELPPRSLRPRRLTEDFHVIPVQRVELAEFDEVRQQLRVVVLDAEDQPAQLVVPYHVRGEASLDAFAAALENAELHLKFVAGHCSVGRGRVEVRPVGCVFERGEKRIMVQPWIEPPVVKSKTEASIEQRSFSMSLLDPIFAAHHQLGDRLADTLLIGVRRSGEAEWSAWTELLDLHERTGFVQLSQPMRELVNLLAERRERRQWESLPAARALLVLAALYRLAVDL